ncbi:4Fe-4S dicluster domain-containing protein [Candidatus Gracilibacteria bacterium]|nr:4Fe-4S dicluster domain-containing protein [Candidatus Gracilibacteria bacterium]
MHKKGFCLPKKEFGTLFTALQSFGEVIAPVKKDKFLRMEKIENPKEITWEGISWFSSKKYVFPEKQTLFKFKGEKTEKWNENPSPKVLFGLRLCDLNAFAINDKLFLNQKPKLPFYKKFRENLLLVGLWCDTPQDEYCFCDSMKLQHKYDLCLFDRGDNFHIKIGSPKGEKILKKLKLKAEDYEKELAKCEKKLNTTDIKKYFENNEIWKKGEKDCLSCGTCTILCPTCLCFDIEDESNLKGTCGKRCVQWDSCMYKDFTLVSGKHHFRGERLDRFKHRIFHKLDYFKEQFGESMCTGCGRCIRGCPTKIDWVSLINKGTSDK